MISLVISHIKLGCFELSMMKRNRANILSGVQKNKNGVDKVEQSENRNPDPFVKWSSVPHLKSQHKICVVDSYFYTRIVDCHRRLF